MAVEFNPLRIYDAPDVFLTQLLEGEASWQSLKDTFFGPERLTPQERSDLADAIVGPDANRLTRTAIGIVTNPFIWAGFAMGPVAQKGIRATGKIFEGAAYNAYTQKRLGLFQQLGLVSPLDGVVGVGAETAFIQIANNLKRLEEADDALVGVAEEALLDRVHKITGKRSLDPQRHKGAHRELVSKIQAALDVDFFELDRPVEEAITKAKRVSYARARSDVNDQGVRSTYTETFRQRDGSVTVAQQAADVERVNLANRKLRRQLMEELEGGEAAFYKSLADPQVNLRKHEIKNRERAFASRRAQILGETAEFVPHRFEFEDGTMARGALSGSAARFMDDIPEVRLLAQARKDVMRRSYVRLAGDELHFAETGKFRPDRDKLEGLTHAFLLDKGQEGWRVANALEGKELISAVLGPDRLKLIRETGDVKQVLDDLEQAFRAVDFDKGHWAPRNVLKNQDVDGKQFSRQTNEGLYETPGEHYTAQMGRRVQSGASPHTEKELLYNADDLERIGRHFGLTDEGDDMVRNARDVARKTYDGKGAYYATAALDSDLSFHRYMGDSRRGTVLWSMDASPEAKAAFNEALPSLHENRAGLKRFRSLAEGDTRLSDPLEGRATYGMIMDRIHGGIENSALRAKFRDVYMPSAVDRMSVDHKALLEAQHTTKWIAEGLANSALPLPAEMRESLREFAAAAPSLREVGSVSNKVAQFMYVSHLGLNMGSVALNLMQPLLHAALIADPDDVFKAYGSALKSMAGYMDDRLALGLGATAAQKQALVRRHFKWADESGIGVQGGWVAEVDEVMGQRYSHRSKFQKVGDFMMIPFQKAEWLNRTVAAEIAERTIRRQSRRPLTHAEMSVQVQRFVGQTQFGGNRLNTPEAFQRGLLANPLTRTFLPFMVRSFHNSAVVFPRAAGGGVGGLFHTTMRGLGTSAFLYEVGKGMLGADISKGLYASASTELFGGERFREGDGEWIYMPPVVDIPVDFMQSFMGEDIDLMSRTVSRMLPGGVALSRALGVAPSIPVPPLSTMQRTYADWNNPDPMTGEIPLMDNYGRMIGTSSRTALIAKGLGLDMDVSKGQGNLDAYLMKQRDQVSEMERRYMQAMMNGRHGEADAINAEMLKRYGVPVNISRQQFNNYVEATRTPRTERLMRRVQSDVRPQFEQLARDAGALPQREASERGDNARFDEHAMKRLETKIMSRLEDSKRQEAFKDFDPGEPF